MKWLSLAIMTIGVLGGCAAKQAPTDPAMKSVAWLAGTWISDDGQTVSEEHWMQPRGSTMFGVNRTVRNGETAFYEYLCIQNTHEGIFYLASPKGRQPPTAFKMVPNLDVKRRDMLIFENPEHDFPKRIVYQKLGKRLHARVEGTHNGQAASEEWTWRRLK